MSRCSCGSVTPMLAASMAPSMVSAFPESAPALADDLGLASALLHEFQDHVALEHVEDLVGGIDVEVSARIRAADDHRRELRVFPDDLVADRWLEGVAVVLDPPPEVERGERLHEGTLLTSSRGGSPPRAAGGT